MKKHKFPFKIAMDVDGVLADLYSGICHKYDLTHDYIFHWDFNHIADRMNMLFKDKDFWVNEIPLENTPDRIPFEFDYYISSIPSNLQSSRLKWLVNNGFPDKPLRTTKNKGELMDILGIDVLIDDAKHNIASAEEWEKIGILYTPSSMLMLNRTDNLEFKHNATSMHQVFDILKQIDKKSIIL